MEKEIINQILNQLESLRRDQLILLIGILVIFIIINIFQVVYTSRLIEKYKNELKKREIKFNSLNALQLNKLSTLFEIASELKGSSSQVHNRVKTDISKIIETNLSNTYENYVLFCSTNRYAFPKKVKNFIQENNDKLRELKYNLEILNVRNETFAEDSYANSDEKEQVAKKSALQIGDYNFEIESLKVVLFAEQLKVLIEEYFETFE